MKIVNPLNLNDCNINLFIKFVIFNLVLMLTLTSLDLIGFHIPILRELSCFIFLTFIPGLILLRILRIHNINNAETFVLSVGLSVIYLIFLGFLINLFYPLMNIKPISLFPLLVTISSTTLILLVISVCIDKKFSKNAYIKSEKFFNPQVLFLVLIPFFAIIGTYIMNVYQENILLMLLIIIISIIVFLVSWEKIPKKMYPFVIFIISISLLYHTSLISQYLAGYDIHSEYIIAKKVIENSIWYPKQFSAVNSMLSISILGPIYSILLNMNIVWIFKIIYPFLFALVPVTLYQIFLKQTNEKIAFFASLFFMFMFTFYGEMFQLARQEVAELFFVLLILIMISKKMDYIKRSVLSILFTFSLIVSHYSLSYIYIFLVGSLIGLNFIFKRFKEDHSINKKAKVSFTFFIFFTVVLLSWYIYTSESAALVALLNVFSNISNNFLTEFLNPTNTQGLDLVIRTESSYFYLITKLLNFIFSFFISIGFLKVLIEHIFPRFISNKTYKFDNEYLIFSISSFLICLMSITVPFFASALEVTRLYHITLLTLSPFGIIGGLYMLKIGKKILKLPERIANENAGFKFLSILLVTLLLFNSGFVFELMDDTPSSIALSSNKDYPKFNTEELYGAQWLSNSIPKHSILYSDTYGRFILREFNINPTPFWGDTKKIENLPIYLRSFNVKGHIYKSNHENTNEIKLENSNFYWQVLINKNEIYSNGGSQVYI
ncbi:DUF2206 domain-containing protein [Methanobacterium aggregans]|uniref:DUF2206 domain-containing protein n=1 Tax=Methanobacterium aggregans TaxID=1615586 RepID=UPI001AE7915A|nr:DUF2206 domain-containing protein [Methanobacterium aggregans]MBP2047058.1 putative membrane protein [Methanobacterium aggregans]